jgi:hypothetical protein
MEKFILQQVQINNLFYIKEDYFNKIYNYAKGEKMRSSRRLINLIHILIQQLLGDYLQQINVS